MDMSGGGGSDVYHESSEEYSVECVSSVSR